MITQQVGRHEVCAARDALVFKRLADLLYAAHLAVPAVPVLAAQTAGRADPRKVMVAGRSPKTALRVMSAPLRP